jgi:hypothetical protein
MDTNEFTEIFRSMPNIQEFFKNNTLFEGFIITLQLMRNHLKENGQELNELIKQPPPKVVDFIYL